MGEDTRNARLMVALNGVGTAYFDPRPAVVKFLEKARRCGAPDWDIYRQTVGHRKAEGADDTELGLERMQEADIENKFNFGKAESLRFQNSMFEVIEELRIRKTMDVENEMKMKQFMKEKQLLENKHEEAVAYNETLRSMQKEQVAVVKKQFEARMSCLRNENARYATKCDATDKETKLLKDEIRAFQLSKYTLEKRLREMEQKLQLQTTIKDSHLSRLAELDTLADAVNKRVTELSLQQGRLGRNVVEAEKLTRKLNYLNAHQTCLINGYKSELAQLQQDLVKAKVKLDQQPANQHNEQLEIQHKMKVLEDALNSQKDSVAFLTKQLDEKRSEHERTLDLLAAAHSLVEQQVTLNNHSSKVAKKHCATIEELTTQLTSMKTDYDVKCKQLDIETQSHEKIVSDWKTQQQSVFHQLKILQHEHQVLMKHHTDLEDLNTHWAKKNVALVEEVKLLESGVGNHERQSTLACFIALLFRIVYLYPPRNNAQRCNLAATVNDTVLLG
ncbi:Coiled-coil domain-containing protein 73 [Lamellibrachia satsuma]|nr:Coiled-coil domain-containing protein 73 [Lamellibrachia satsuma]